jgi:translocation and assembly module TamB
MLKRLIKIFIYSSISLIGLLFLLLLFIQTPIFKNWLRDFAVKKANESINGQIQIERISGNLISRLSVEGLFIKDQQDTVLYLPRFSIELSPSRVIWGEIFIDSILIDSPYLKLSQLPDSSWNVSHLAKEDTLDQPIDTTATEPFAWNVILEKFNLRNAKIKIAAPDSIIPREIKNFYITCGAYYDENYQKFDLSEFRLTTIQPDFQLKMLSFDLTRDEKGIFLQNFLMQTGKNQLNAQAEYFESEKLNSEGVLKSNALNFNEFQTFVPAIKINAKPDFIIDANYRNDSLTVSVDLTEGDQGIILRVGVGNLSKALREKTQNRVKYSLLGQIENLDVAYWMGDSSMDYVVNGNFNLNGNGMTPEGANVTFSANFPNCIIMQNPVKDINVTGSYLNGNLESKLNILGEFGKLVLNSKIEGLTNEQKFDANLDIKNLNIAGILKNDSLETDLNLTLSIKGKNFNPDSLMASTILKISPSNLNDLQIDSLFSIIHITGQSLLIDTLRLNSNVLQFNLGGNFNLEEDSNLRFKAEIGNLMAVNRFIGADTIQAKGYLKGHVQGRIDSLAIEANINLHDLLYDLNFVDSLAGNLYGLVKHENFEGNTNIRISRAGTPSVVIDEIRLKSNFTQKFANLFLDISRSEDFSAHLESKFFADSMPRIIIPDISLTFKSQEWRGGNENMQLLWGGSDYHIQNFRMTSESSLQNQEQIIDINGTVSMAGGEDLAVKISGIDVGALSQVFEVPIELGGIFSLNIELKGTADEPVLRGYTSFNNGKINEYEFKTFRGKFGYDKEHLNLEFALIPTQTDSFSVYGKIPMKLSLSNSRQVLNENQLMEISIKSDRFPISALQASDITFKTLKGYISCDVKIKGTINEPEPAGYFQIVDGLFEIPEFGVNYNGFNMKVSLAKNSISLDKFSARRDNGVMSAYGTVSFDSSLISAKLKNAHFNFNANKIYLVKHRDYEIQISGDANFSGDLKNPLFGGNLQILRSSFYLPAFTGDETARNVAGESGFPRLVIEQEKLKAKEDSLQTISQKDVKISEEKPPDLYRNLRGKLKVTIPKNTWIKSPDMRVELAGDIDLVKNGPDFEIFGPIRIVRGQYDLFGRRFTIVEGNLNFQGGKEINPEIVLELKYVFRTPSREKKQLNVFVTGKAQSPSIKFTLDGAEISEGDAISYIVFGRSIDQLTSGQKSDVAASSSEGSLGTGANVAANLLSAQLTKAIGSKLNLDYIEVKSEDNWQSASFVVGKYLTTDLFMSYEKQFGETQDKDVTKELVTLEYEMTRFLFLQLLGGHAKYNGFDLIFKASRN